MFGNPLKPPRRPAVLGIKKRGVCKKLKKLIIIVAKIAQMLYTIVSVSKKLQFCGGLPIFTVLKSFD